MVKVKNYTSGVPVERSVSAIEKMLVDAGARNIARTYDAGTVTGFYFDLPADGEKPGGENYNNYSLPCRTETIEQKFFDEKVRKSRRNISHKAVDDIYKQAGRTAWRLLFEWLHIQLSLVQTGQVALDEIFLPYRLVSRKETVYQVLKSADKFKLLKQ